jgi:hypothetical protein
MLSPSQSAADYAHQHTKSIDLDAPGRGAGSPADEHEKHYEEESVAARQTYGYGAKPRRSRNGLEKGVQ